MNTPLLPEAHDALADAVSRAGRSERRAGRSRQRLLLAAAGVVFVAGTATAATTGWNPVLGHRRDGASAGSQPPYAARGVPPQAAKVLGILRRPATAADHGPRVRRLLRGLQRGVTDGVHIDAIRVLTTRNGGVTALIPIDRVGRAHGHTYAPLRNALCLYRTQVSAYRTVRFTVDGKRYRSRSGGFTAGYECQTLHTLTTKGISFSEAGFPRDQPQYSPPQRLTALVPDGVARVRLTVNGGRHITTAVNDNLYEVHLDPTTGQVRSTQWLNAKGTVIRTIAREP
jgi:hypothetical protein